MPVYLAGKLIHGTGGSAPPFPPHPPLSNAVWVPQPTTFTLGVPHSMFYTDATAIDYGHYRVGCTSNGNPSTMTFYFEVISSVYGLLNSDTRTVTNGSGTGQDVLGTMTNRYARVAGEIICVTITVLTSNRVGIAPLGDIIRYNAPTGGAYLNYAQWTSTIV